MLTVESHPFLDLGVFRTSFSKPLAQLPEAAAVHALLSLRAPAPLTSDDSVRLAVRDLLRAGGFKPTGRSKPASEYLLKAVEEGRLTPINMAVDVCNAVSLHSGLPITVAVGDISLAAAKLPLTQQRAAAERGPHPAARGELARRRHA